MDRAQYARAREIFLSAVRLAPDQRASFLKERCAGDPALRGEVESLLQHHIDRTLIARPPPSREKESGTPEARLFREPRRSLDLRERTLASWLAGSRLRRTLAIALTTILAVAIGTWTYRSVRTMIHQYNAEHLRAVLGSTVIATRMWIDDRIAEVTYWANYAAVRGAVEELVEVPRDDPAGIEALRQAPAQQRLQVILGPFLREPGSVGFGILDDRGVLIASSWTVGLKVSRDHLEDYARIVFGGESLFVGPGILERSLVGEISDLAQLAVTKTASSVRDADGNVIGVLALAQRANLGLGQFTQAARTRETGETYLFDANAVILTESRFTEELKSAGLVPDEPGAHSAFRTEARDPGGDLSAGHVPTRPLRARPLTKLAALAIASRSETDPSALSGVVLEPYRNYRGREVIGAWAWIPEHRFGIATELEAREAYAPIRRLSLAFLLLVSLVGVAVGVSLISSWLAIRFRREVEEYERLGAYDLKEQIGEGGMGAVYLARHALLKRPTAIKVLPLNRASATTRSRFEREARLASRLTHPNTIQIYDFGTSPDGMFYYAMEFVDGLSLAELIDRDGAIPAARVVFLLRQVCASLREAHAEGLIHRDIKPPNIMVSDSGGQYDFVKVLDFGLVKDVEASEDVDVTLGTMVGGTPCYMAPEQLTSPGEVDARADLFALGSVAYNLLTARRIFSRVTTPADVAIRLEYEAPVPPSVVVESPIPARLERLVMRCLARDPDERPGSVAEVLDVLDGVQRDHPWSSTDAEAWWNDYRS